MSDFETGPKEQKTNGNPVWVTDSVEAYHFEGPEKAPHYGEEFKMIRCDAAIIVRRGTKQGRSTIDLLCIDAQGNKYIIMTTARILHNIAKDAVDHDEQFLKAAKEENKDLN